MRTLRLVVALAVVLSLRVPLAGSQETDEPNFISVPLPTWFKFTVGDHPKAFGFSLDNESDYVLTTCDEMNQLRIAISRGDFGGLIFKSRLELPFPPKVWVADLDGDSKAEVLVCSDQLRIFRVREDGVELVWTSTETFDPMNPPFLGLSDFDDDGAIDIVILNQIPGKQITARKSLYLYLNQKNNTQFSLSGTAKFTDPRGYHSTYGLAIGDFSGDDRPDLVVGNTNGWMWLVGIENGRPILERHWKVPSGDSTGTAFGSGLKSGNLIAGGKKELLVGTSEGDLFVYKFSSERSPEVIASATTERIVYDVQVADMDGDGLDEFVLSRGDWAHPNTTFVDPGTEIWKLHDGKLVNIWQQKATGFRMPRLMLQDLDHDGTPEFVSYSVYGKGKAIEAFKPVLGR